MPCQDCAGLHVELLTLKEFMAQWFNILMKKIEVVEKQNTALSERLELSNVSDKYSDHQSTTDGLISSVVNGSKSPSTVNKSPTPISMKKRSNKNNNRQSNQSATAVISSTSNTLNDRINFLMNRATQQAQTNNENSHDAIMNLPTETQVDMLGNALNEAANQHDPMRLFPSMAFTSVSAGDNQNDEQADDNNNDDLHLNDMSDVKLSIALNDMSSDVKGMHDMSQDDVMSNGGVDDSNMFNSDGGLNSFEDDEDDPEKNGGKTSNNNVAIITGPGKFTCRLCRSHFTQMSNLRRHVRVIHQGLTKHACRYCGKVFAWKGAWRRHEQFVHELRGSNGNAVTASPASAATNAAPTAVTANGDMDS